jgi:hypothetical protein
MTRPGFEPGPPLGETRRLTAWAMARPWAKGYRSMNNHLGHWYNVLFSCPDCIRISQMPSFIHRQVHLSSHQWSQPSVFLRRAFPCLYTSSLICPILLFDDHNAQPHQECSFSLTLTETLTRSSGRIWLPLQSNRRAGTELSFPRTHRNQLDF